MKSDWLYDSIEKGYCLEEKQFALSKDAGEKSEVKTSTPEKESGPRGKELIRVGGMLRKCSEAKVIYIGTEAVTLVIWKNQRHFRRDLGKLICIINYLILVFLVFVT